MINQPRIVQHITCLIAIVFTFFNVKISHAQDIHYSQFYNAPLNINPANTGIFNGDRRIMGSYKDQWRTVPVPWTTFTLSYDQKFYPKRSDKHFFTGGLALNYDKQGLSNLTLTNINISGGYTLVVNESNLLSIAGLVGFASRGFNLESLTWDSQWTDGVFDGTISSGENFNADRVNFIENGLGINYRWQKSSRTKVDIGVGGYHLIEPKVAFYEADDIRLDRRITGQLVGQVQLGNALDFQLHGFGQFQGEHNEVLVGGLFKLHLSQQRGREFELHLGAGYRTSGSLFPTIAIQYSNIYASFSYDIDLSDFDVHTNNRGGPELHFNYILTSVKPVKHFKICPIY